MNFKTKLLFYIFFVTVSSSLICQSITNLDYNVLAKQIEVKYNLENCLPKTAYNLSLDFLNDKGETIIAKSIYGDIHKVSCGNNKKIVWDVLKDKQELKGKFAAQLHIEKIYKPAKGGPSNALLSILVPGLGDYFVDDEQVSIAPALVTTAAYGSILAGILYKLSSKENYQKYRESKRQSDMDAYYSNANEFNRIGNLWLGIGIGVWAWDVCYVFIKGIRNNKQNKFLSFVQKNKFSIAYQNNQNFNIKYTLQF